jgi:hypothetical protein
VIILLGDPPPASSGVHTLRNMLHDTLFTPEQSPNHRKKKYVWNSGFVIVLNPHLEVQRLAYRPAETTIFPAGLRERELASYVRSGCRLGKFGSRVPSRI